jgi:hypothetical protein
MIAARAEPRLNAAAAFVVEEPVVCSRAVAGRCARTITGWERPGRFL